MLTRTSVTATRLLMHVASDESTRPAVIARAARRLDESPTYLSKVARLLVKAGILRAHRGVGGGVTMNRAPHDVTLRSIVEACQGAILPDSCQGPADLRHTCAFHRATSRLHQSIIRVLTDWTLAQFLRRPGPKGAGLRTHACRMQMARQGAPPRRQKGRAR
jgi:Rrf2 family transcriptional regulator, nitric oxide-sensitive transcriptional repressor